MTNKTFQAVIKEPFFRYRKLSLSLVFNSQTYFTIPKEVRLNSTHYLIVKIHNQRELQSIATNHSANIDYENFMNIHRKCANELCSFFTVYITLPASNFFRFRKNLLIRYKNDIN